MKRVLIKIYWILSSQFGIDPLRFYRSLRSLPQFIADWWEFRQSYQGKLTWVPCLHDRYEESGTTKSEYFWQDLMVARWIYEARPQKHVDVGSRVDGFVAHVASFREIEVFDVRPTSTPIPGVIFKQADLMDIDSLPECNDEGGGYCDSLSCLHALEHFGLGRYGDPLNCQGYLRGIENMAKLLRLGGKFYLSTPIGKERVEFNANWVFNPITVINSAKDSGLELQNLLVFESPHGFKEVKFDDANLFKLTKLPYQLGVFIFTKTSTL